MTCLQFVIKQALFRIFIGSNGSPWRPWYLCKRIIRFILFYFLFKLLFIIPCHTGFMKHCLVFGICSCKLRSCPIIFHLCSHDWWQLTNLLKSFQILCCWKIRALFCTFTTPKRWNKFTISIFLTKLTVCPIYFSFFYRFSFGRNQHNICLQHSKIQI